MLAVVPGLLVVPGPASWPLIVMSRVPVAKAPVVMVAESVQEAKVPLTLMPGGQERDGGQGQHGATAAAPTRARGVVSDRWALIRMSPET